MERVTFLLEETGERIPCLLNPESIRQTRVSGVRPRRSLTGVITGAEHLDDPLLFTGGGTTDLLMDLLFDVSLVRPPKEIVDVRDLTAPLWRLAENSQGEKAQARPPRIRFVWGTSWNIPGVVAAVAEKLEHFTAEGIPRRSWLRMRFLRTAEPGFAEPQKPVVPDVDRLIEEMGPGPGEPHGPEEHDVHELLGGGPGDEGATGERLDQIASAEYGDPSLWRFVAAFNGIMDPLRMQAGTLLRIPPLSFLLGRKP